jgi:hypothetical protein
LSETSVKLTLAIFCQTVAALANCAFQSDVANLAFSVACRLLGTPPMLVPSGTKL